MQLQSRLAHFLLHGRYLDYAFAVLVIFCGSKALTFYQMQSKLWLLAYGLFFLAAALHFRRFVAQVISNKIFFAYPILCLVSTIWSEVPVESVRFGIQLVISTGIAVYIGLRLTINQIFWCTAGVFFMLSALSVFNYGSILFPAFDHRENFVGIYQSKTALGHSLIIFSGIASLIVFVLKDISFLVRVAMFAMLIAAIWMTIISGSATASATLGMSVFAPATVYYLYHSSLARALIVLILGCFVAAITFASVANSVDPYTYALNLMGRDPTLTGRSYLWDHGMALFWDNPILGLGANSYWTAHSFQNSVIQFQSLYGEGVVSFHNLVVELLVMVGPLGFLTHAAACIYAFICCMRLGVRFDSVFGIWAAVFIALQYFTALVGTFFYKPHDLILMLMIGLAVAARRELEVLSRRS